MGEVAAMQFGPLSITLISCKTVQFFRENGSAVARNVDSAQQFLYSSLRFLQPIEFDCKNHESSRYGMKYHNNDNKLLKLVNGQYCNIIQQKYIVQGLQYFDYDLFQLT